MQLEQFYHQSGNRISFERQQASRFAKEVADDFNPLHNIEAKLFCVPGDLLFSVALRQLGLSQHMQFTFSGMVSDNALLFPQSDAAEIQVVDEFGKSCLGIKRQGDCSHNQHLISNLSCAYVTFSGQTFPHILVPLMAEQNVMINPKRPLIMYQSMEINLNHLQLSKPKLAPADNKLQINGKKGNVHLGFDIIENDKVVGSGVKHMSLRGLLPYEKGLVNKLIEEYNEYKRNYSSPSSTTTPLAHNPA